MSTAYDSDLTAEQWELLEPLIPAAKSGGRPRTTDMLSVLNTIFYLVVTGCQWRQLPHDFHCWSTVYSYFRKWLRILVTSGSCPLLVMQNQR